MRARYAAAAGAAKPVAMRPCVPAPEPLLPALPILPVPRVMHPSSGITKEYSVTLDRKPRQEDLNTIAAGELPCPPLTSRHLCSEAAGL